MPAKGASTPTPNGSRPAPGGGRDAVRAPVVAARARAAAVVAPAADVAVVGGGVIGLSVAWLTAQSGRHVSLFERGPLPGGDAADARGAGASRVAAGMLAPVSEADAGEPALLRAGLESLELWPSFAARLEQEAGLSPGFRPCGTLMVARDADEAAWLERERALRAALGVPVARLRGSEARRREPALAPGVRGALDLPGDHAVDPRALLAALAVACERAGVALHPHHDVVRWDAGGVELPGGVRAAAGRVVIAAGAWSGAPVRPVKGEILRLRDPQGPGLLERVLRFERGYLVPRGDGRYVLGATSEERGFDTTVTARGVRELLAEAQLVVPGLDEMTLEEASAGLRPGTPDNAPLIGDADGVLLATGHHRSGILLAPFTAGAVLAILDGGGPPAAFAPQRFAAVPA